MRTIKSILTIVFIAALTVAFTGCNEDDEIIPVVSTTISNLPADPGTGFDPTNGQPLGLTRNSLSSVLKQVLSLLMLTAQRQIGILVLMELQLLLMAQRVAQAHRWFK
jgi:hypothetical protein